MVNIYRKRQQQTSKHKTRKKREATWKLFCVQTGIKLQENTLFMAYDSVCELFSLLVLPFSFSFLSFPSYSSSLLTFRNFSVRDFSSRNFQHQASIYEHAYVCIWMLEHRMNINRVSAFNSCDFNPVFSPLLLFQCCAIFMWILYIFIWEICELKDWENFPCSMHELMTEYDTENCQVIIKLFLRIEDYNLKEVFTTLWRCEIWEIVQEQFWI